jgi:imidazole glycerol phosphate synthase subunit HisF
MVMKVDQQVADQVTIALGIGGQIDHFEETEWSFTYGTDDGKMLTVHASGWYNLITMDEELIQRGSVAFLLGLPE